MQHSGPGENSSLYYFVSVSLSLPLYLSPPSLTGSTSFKTFSYKKEGRGLVNQLLASIWGSYINPPFFFRIPLPPVYVIDEDSRVYVYEHECWTWQG